MPNKYLTKGILFLMAVCLVFSLSACKGKDGENSQPEDSSGAESSQSAEEQPGGSESGPGSEAEGEATPEPSPTPEPTPEPPKLAQGRFVCLSDSRYTDDKAPSLVIKDDGSFEFYINLGDVRPLGLAKGTYEISGAILTASIGEKDNGDFLGHDLQELQFEILGDNYLRYNSTSYGLTLKNNIFTREGAPAFVPTPEPTKAPDVPEATPEALPEESPAPEDEAAISGSILEKGY